MMGAKPSIFRAEALRNYTERREAAVYPKLVSPRVFAIVWIVTGLLFSGALFAWAASIPVYSSGLAVVLDRNKACEQGPDTATILVLLPPAELSRLRIGQRVSLDLDKGRATTRGEVIGVEPQLVDAMGIRDRFGPTASTAAATTEPMAIAVSKFEQLPDGFDCSPNTGHRHRALIQIGTRRVISLFHP